MKNWFLNDRFILFIILINALLIFVEGFRPPSPYNKWIELADHFCTLLFIVEAVIKIFHYRWLGYWASSWNRFDFTLVILALPSFADWLFDLPFLSLNFLLVFRIMRVFKFFRFLRFIPNVSHILDGITRAMKSSILIIAAFFIFNFIVSLISCFMFRELAPEYFKDPLLALYSIFKVFTVEGWFEIPDTIAARASETVAFFVRIYFIIILFFGGIFGLSLVNSIFVDSMISDNNDEIERKLVEMDKKIERLLKQTNPNKE